MDRQKEFVLRTLEERDIRFVRLWFTDVLGYLKSVAIAPAELEGAFEEGIGFDGSSIEGFARVSESDTVARPDPSTFQVLPWTSSAGQHHSARMFCDITMPDGSPSWADSRHVLRRQLAKASDLGFSCYVHPEIEFFLLQPGPDDGSIPVPADNGGYFDQAVHDSAPNFRRHAIDALEQMGISVEFSHHEGAPGQQEIDLRYADALSMADNVMTFRYVVKEVALGDGVKASFMPKPFAEYPGSAMHTHMSLFEGETNAFYSADDPLQLSDTGKSFIAGILEHATEISAVTNQWVNSYKRLVHGGEAPTAASWGCGQPVGIGPGADVHTAQGVVASHRGAKPRLGLQPVPDVRRAAGRRPTRRGEELRARAPGRGQRLEPHPRGTSGDGLPRTAGQPRCRAGADGGLRARRGSVGRARVRLLPPQQARRVGELPQPRHAVRAQDLPVALADRDTGCATVVDVAKPATQRPKLPSVGRLGLVEPSAPADLNRLGWNTDTHVELLWSLSRAPDADIALKAMVRLAEASGRDWDELNHALLKDKALRGRLFGVLGSSLALGDHLAPTRGRGICWRAM